MASGEKIKGIEEQERRKPKNKGGRQWKLRCRGKETVKQVSEEIGQIRRLEIERPSTLSATSDTKAAITRTNIFIIPFLINFSMNLSPGEIAAA